MCDVQAGGDNGDCLSIRIKTSTVGCRVASQCQSTDDNMALPTYLPCKSVRGIKSIRICSAGTDNGHCIVPVEQFHVA